MADIAIEALDDELLGRGSLELLTPDNEESYGEYFSPTLSRQRERERLRAERRRRALAKATTAGAAVLGVRYLLWRAGTLGSTGLTGKVILASEIVAYSFFLVSAFLMWDVRRPARVTAPARGTLDVFIPVCGEPVSIVERTIEAALAIDYPHRTYLLNDCRVAGKGDWRAMDRLAAACGIQCFTRTVGPLKKAGNLNYALSRTSGDFVAVIDADHAVEPRFGHELLGYFANPGVGFVTTPQRFRTTPRDVLGNREEFFYGHIQPAKDTANSAFSTGSGVIYRREALESIDGFSEWNIVEDLYSSYQMHACGWESVYHDQPLTSGLCPQVGAEAVKQRLGWATDTMRMFFWDNPILKRGLSWRQRLHYFQIGGFYVVTVCQLPLFLAPILVLILNVPVMEVGSVSNYLSHALPYFLVQFAWVAVPAGFKGGLRAAQKAIYLAPTYLLATLGAASTFHFPTPVTDKAESRRFSPLLAPQCLMFGLLVIGMVRALLEPTAGNAIAALWAGWVASALAIPIFTFKARSARVRALRPLLRTAVTILTISALLVAPS